jgi:hypothetical protein
MLESSGEDTFWRGGANAPLTVQDFLYKQYRTVINSIATVLKYGPLQTVQNSKE